jgi:hypothetical protein
MASAVAAVAGALVIAPSWANVSPSTFESNDGNLIVNNTKDWANVADVATGVDKPSGKTDNSFGQGTKENDVTPTIVTGSIPPNKNDLTRFYEADEQVVAPLDGNKLHTFLYLAWERLVNIGSANMDFEINQFPTTGFTANTTGQITLNRTAGDLLIGYEFSGSGNPTLTLQTWTGSVWGPSTTLGSNIADGAVNTVSVLDPLQDPDATLGIGLFGEAAIDLTAAGVFPSDKCVHFGSAFVKSATSGSTQQDELKDFIAPVSIDVSNCGSITIRKVTQNGDSSFGYTTTGALDPSTFSLSNGGSKTYDSLNPGTYSVTENLTQAQIAADWTLVSIDCTPSGSGTSAVVSGATANITLGGGGSVDCTYTNHTKLSPTISTLLSSDSVEVGGTVHDSSTLSGATATAGGTVTYTVYTDSACSSGAQSAGTKTVTNGVVPDSDPITFNTAGDYYWQAVYSGDADNNGATSTCTEEHLVVNKKSPSASTLQNLLPNDTFTLSDGFNATGNVTFSLYPPSNATCQGIAAYTQTVSLASDGTATTTNSSFYASAEGTWRWVVTYTGDSNNNGVTLACGTERFTIANS